MILVRIISLVSNVQKLENLALHAHKRKICCLVVVLVDFLLSWKDHDQKQLGVRVYLAYSPRVTVH